MNQHQYTAIFQIGAKLLGTFESSMRQAQSRLKALQRTVRETSTAIKGIASSFKYAFAGIAAFGAAALFKKVFTGAFEAAASAQERALALTNELYVHMRKQGREAAADQTKLLLAYNKELAKTGVLSHQIYDTMAVSLSKIGLSTREMAEIEPVLADVLVHARGVRASAEDADELADTLLKVAKGGRQIALMKFGIYLNPSERERLKAYKDDWRGALQYLFFFLKNYKGFNEEVARTPLGQIQRMYNLFGDLAEEIGATVLPAQADMAQAWQEALPVIEPAIIATMTEIAKVLTWITREVSALIDRLAASDIAKDFEEVMKAAHELWTTLGLEWPEAGFFGKLIGSAIILSIKILTTELKILLKTLNAVAKAISYLPPVVIAKWLGRRAVASGKAGKEAIPTEFPLPYPGVPTAPRPPMPTGPVPAYARPGGYGYGPQRPAPAPHPAVTAPWALPVSRVPAIPAEPTTRIWSPTGGAGGAGFIPPGATMPYGGTAPYGGGVGGAGFGAGGPAISAVPPASAREAVKGSELYTKLLTEFRAHPPQGVPPDAARFGIVKGTPEEWARWGLSVAHAESSFNPRSTNLSDPGGSFGVFQYSHGQAYGNAYDVDNSVRAFVRDADAAAARGAISGSMLAKRFSTIGKHPGVGAAYLSQAESIAAQQAATQANAPPPLLAAYQRGGIAMLPQLATLAERGPEAVLPLSGARGLLSGMLGGGVERAFHLTHSPVIHIHGDADEEAMGAMTGKLRDAAMEFINNFKAAQRHERRLSYESGYGS
jgi:hypothetical protein